MGQVDLQRRDRYPTLRSGMEIGTFTDFLGLANWSDPKYLIPVRVLAANDRLGFMALAQPCGHDALQKWKSVV